MTYTLHLGDCLEVMAGMEAQSVDSIVCDPPYGLSFMGKNWDHGVPGVAFWAEALRVAKPGAHLLAFGGTRTFHRLAVAIEDAGWEIRDTIMWVYGNGFPKSLNVGKAIDKAAGAEREVVATIKKTPSASSDCNEVWVRPWAEGKTTMDITAPATDAAKQWDGWGTALKPAWEPVIVARKPLEGTVAANVLKWGTGAINVDGCRVETEDKLGGGTEKRSSSNFEAFDSPWKHDTDAQERMAAQVRVKVAHAETLGRWPANLIHDGSEEVLAGFPVTTSGGRLSSGAKRSPRVGREQYGDMTQSHVSTDNYGDTGSAARFYYCAKASKKDRDEGCKGLPQLSAPKTGAEKRITVGGSKDVALPRGNHHPTVKPTDLMRYLCRLVTPPGGVVLDPFMGSGSTGKGAILEGFRFIGIEQDAEYIEIARRRIEYAKM